MLTRLSSWSISSLEVVIWLKYYRMAQGLSQCIFVDIDVSDNRKLGVDLLSYLRHKEGHLDRD